MMEKAPAFGDTCSLPPAKAPAAYTAHQPEYVFHQERHADIDQRLIGPEQVQKWLRGLDDRYNDNPGSMDGMSLDHISSGRQP